MDFSNNDPVQVCGNSHVYVPLKDMPQADSAPQTDNRRFSYEPPGSSDRNLSSSEPMNRSYDPSVSDQKAPDTAGPTRTKQHNAQGAYYDEPPGLVRKFGFSDWLWEFTAAGFSLACVVVVIVLLCKYENKALASWKFLYDINLNTLVALLSTLSRTALIIPVASCISQLKWIHLIHSPRPLRELQTFDDASRGPWGSLELIWRLHVKTKLAAWGAIITIVSLAMGPMAQQLVSYSSRPHMEPSGAVVRRTQIYESGTSTAWLDPSTSDQIGISMEPKMEGAILNGLYNLSAPVPFECKTGNCEWGNYTTLAATSACTNVTPETTTTCGDRAAYTYECNHTTPSGFPLRTSSSISSRTPFCFNSTARKIGASSQHIGYNRHNSSLAAFATAKVESPFFESGIPEFFECDIRLVARLVRNTKVVNGTFVPGNEQDFEVDGIISSAIVQAIRYTIVDNDATFPGNRTFSIDSIDMEGTTRLLQRVFSSSHTSSYGLALMKSTNLPRTVADISRSVNYALGQAPSAEDVQGRTIEPEQYIQVHWLWIILPVAEITMAIAFLLATLVRTSRAGVLAWKSSAIVPLLIALDGWDYSNLRTATWKEVEGQAEFMHGLLVQDSSGVQRFRRMDGYG